jgi:hypothetical protein
MLPQLLVPVGWPLMGLKLWASQLWSVMELVLVLL